MAIQHRRGIYRDFDPQRMLPGEWGIVMSGDPKISDGKSVYICLETGNVKRVAMFEDMAEAIADANDELIAEITAAVTAATQAANDAARQAEDGEVERTLAEESRASAEESRAFAEAARTNAEAARSQAESERDAAETARAAAEVKREDAEYARSVEEGRRDTAETLRGDAEYARSSAESQRVTDEASRVANEAERVTNETLRVANESERVANEAQRVASFAEMEQRSKGWLRYYCADGEYDADSREPLVEEPDTATLYYVPEAHPTSESEWMEWMWDTSDGDGRWEALGTTEATVSPITTAIIDSVVADGADTGSEVLQTTGLSYLWSKLKAAFAAITHTHAASDITSGQLAIANGGTGASTAAAAASAIVNGNAIAPSSVAATGAVSGSSVSDSVGSLAALRESVSPVETSVTRSFPSTVSGNLYCYRVGRIAFVCFDGFSVAASASGWVTVANGLPKAYKRTAWFQLVSDTATVLKIQITATGEMRIRNTLSKETFNDMTISYPCA